MFELRCADVHPVRCDEAMRSANRDELLARAREHGERAHGFTSVWYSAGRLAAMAKAVRAR
jgi:predicted small metal-binding protein